MSRHSGRAASRIAVWALAATIVGSQSGVAVASDGPAGARAADDVAKFIADVTPASEVQVPVVAEADGTFEAVLLGGDAMVLPAAGNGAVMLAQSGITIGLPSDEAAGGVAAADGTIVYGAGTAEIVTAVQNEADALQVQTIVQDESIDAFTYDIDGAVPVLREDGGVDLVVQGEQPNVSEVLAQFEVPWAVDASGDPVPTRYAILDGAVVQEISTDAGTAFPVVADPRVSYGLGMYIAFNRAEIRAIATVLGTVAALGQAAGCVVLVSKLPAAAKGWVGWLCGSVGFGATKALIASMPSRAVSYYTASCYQMRIPAQSPALKVVAASKCNTIPFGSY